MSSSEEQIVEATGLPIIGRERALIDGLTKELHTRAKRHYDYEDVRRTARGAAFRVMLDPGEEGGYGARIARITIELESLTDSAPQPPASVPSPPEPAHVRAVDSFPNGRGCVEWCPACLAEQSSPGQAG